MNTIEFAVSEAQDIARYLSGVREEELRALIEEIIQAKRIFIGGAGRSLLPMKMFAMRLMQLGREVYLAGEVCTPGLRAGDLFLAASCSGTTQITLFLLRKAQRAGAKTMLLTARMDRPEEADGIVHLPDPYSFQEAWGRKESEIYEAGRSPKSLFEAALIPLTDAVLHLLKAHYGMRHVDMHKNHANLE